MGYNFWSKFIFTWNFYKIFIALSATCIQNVSIWHAPFVSLSHSVAVAAGSGIQRVDPQMIHCELFYHLVRRSLFNPQQYYIYIYIYIYIWRISRKKIITPAPFHSKAYVLLHKSETSRVLLGRLSRGFFCLLRCL